jgi:hypothetical protein
MGAGGWDKSRVAANVVLQPWDMALLDEQVTDPANCCRSEAPHGLLLRGNERLLTVQDHSRSPRVVLRSE